MTQSSDKLNDLTHNHNPDAPFDHLDHEQLMTAIRELRKEAFKLIEQGRSLLDALFNHNIDPQAHIDLRTGLDQLAIQLQEDLTAHNVDERSHPYIIAKLNELAAAIQKLRDDMIPAINSAIIAHNVDPDSHSEAMHKHDTDPEAHRNIISELQDFLKNHNVDPDAHANLFEYLKKADIFRYSRIGEVMPGHLMGDYNQGMFIPADGRYIDVDLYPELKKKIAEGHIFVRGSYSNEFPGIWSFHQGTLYRAPNFSLGGNRFMRFSTNAGDAGKAEADTMQKITGMIQGFTYPGYHGGGIELFTQNHKGYGVERGSLYCGYTTRDESGYGGGYTASRNSMAYQLHIDTSRDTRTSTETRPTSIYQLPIIYLGSKS